MGSISSVNPGITTLLQTLSNVDSPVLSSPSVLSALEKASPSDVVQLSSAALQLENVDAMFGMPSSSSSTALNSLLASLEAPQTTTTPSLTSSGASPADQAASYQAALQQSEAQTLFGLESTGAPSSAFNIFG